MKRDTEEMRLWLFDLAHDDESLSNEKIVQGFLKHYALHGLTLEHVKQDIFFHTAYGIDNCMAAMERLELAIKYFADREESRTLTEVQAIVDAVREGISVQVGYYDPEIDDDPYVVRKCW